MYFSHVNKTVYLPTDLLSFFPSDATRSGPMQPVPSIPDPTVFILSIKHVYQYSHASDGSQSKVKDFAQILINEMLMPIIACTIE